MFSMLQLDSCPLFDLNNLAAARAVMQNIADAGKLNAPAPIGVVIDEVIVPATEDGPDVLLRITRPESCPSATPALLWFHGGGMVMGHAAQDDPLAARLARTLNCRFISVEYRLAPEHPFPAALHDGFAAYAWLVAHGDEIGVRQDQIALGGFSAGGGLAAAVGLMARDRGLPMPLFQALMAPMLDDRQQTLSSQEDQYMGVWNRHANALAWKAYLSTLEGNIPVYAAPARSQKLAGLPPAFIAVGELDLFRDEALAYVQRLVAAGVPTEFHLYPGACHGFEGLNPEASISKSLDASWIAYMTRQFGLARV
ncbi:alpha/beta hydrolase [Aquisediminimonas sediminicola]|uniref:alpha/beta hydrolase n=1 Tax=Alteraquisediminimonas sediminicola TaxID=2676787 RepID=UPI001C8ECEC5|nr:alpha/beta hydrolase [Aquisediminimonas sediminicola]